MSRAASLRGLFGFAALALLTAAPARAGLISDPPNDTFGTGTFKPDIISFGAVTNLQAGTTTFVVNFAQAIAPPSDTAPNSVVGFIDIDIDRNPFTGTPPQINTTPGVPGPPILLGDEYVIDLLSELFQRGLVDVLDTSTMLPVGPPVPIAFTGTGFTLTVPLVGTRYPGSLNYGILVGDFSSPSDRAPNGELPAQSEVPEPATLLLLLVGLGGLAARRRSRA